ncbi:hypothetical protein LTS07_003747 [Exophiala sideris]|uniref:Uncharacterized protein n=1 Tax=Exophiala sideris TaxID=1016849 RepID=A0ABR0JH00_9EURO|nr:hypothetical protein LTS07_003747 [Exophiala sideris]KAK5063988.1 hypothetical protein LTR69_003755 [Exophiala sideris]
MRALLDILILAWYLHSVEGITIVNGQIYTPGLAIIDAPQPGTPEGGDYLQVAIDVSGDGRLGLPPYPQDVNTGILNMTIFLFSYATVLNLTISNGTSAGWTGLDDPSADLTAFRCSASTTAGWENAGCAEIMLQESGSTVKHVKWAWPDCLVGDGAGGSERGLYNISIHQSFRLNGTGFYTIFNLPIEVTNSIPSKTQLSVSGKRPLCASRENVLQSQTSQDASASTPSVQPYLGGAVSGGGGGATKNGSSCARGRGVGVFVLFVLVAGWTILS